MAFSTLQALGKGKPVLPVTSSFGWSFSSSGDCSPCVTCGRWAQWIWLMSASGRSGPRAPTVRQCPWPAPGPAATSSLSPRTFGMTTRVHPSPPARLPFPLLPSPHIVIPLAPMVPGVGDSMSLACLVATSNLSRPFQSFLIHNWGVVRAPASRVCKGQMHLTDGCNPK